MDFSGPDLRGAKVYEDSADGDGYSSDNTYDDDLISNTADKGDDGYTSECASDGVSQSSLKSPTDAKKGVPNVYPWALPHKHDFVCDVGDEISVLFVPDKSWRPGEVLHVDDRCISVHFPLHHDMVPIRVEKNSRMLWRGDDIRTPGICDLDSLGSRDGWVVNGEQWVLQMTQDEFQKALPRKFSERGLKKPHKLRNPFKSLLDDDTCQGTLVAAEALVDLQDPDAPMAEPGDAVQTISNANSMGKRGRPDEAEAEAARLVRQRRNSDDGLDALLHSTKQANADWANPHSPVTNTVHSEFIKARPAMFPRTTTSHAKEESSPRPFKPSRLAAILDLLEEGVDSGFDSPAWP